MCSPQELDQVFVLLKSLVTQGEPGAWDWGLLHTGLYSLKRKPGQLDSGFQAGKEHPREKKKKKKAAWIYKKSKILHVGMFGSSVRKAERQICVPHY